MTSRARTRPRQRRRDRSSPEARRFRRQDRAKCCRLSRRRRGPAERLLLVGLGPARISGARPTAARSSPRPSGWRKQRGRGFLPRGDGVPGSIPTTPPATRSKAWQRAVPHTRHQVRAQAPARETRPLRRRDVGGRSRGGRARRRGRRRHRRWHRADARSREPAGQCLHADLSCEAARKLAGAHKSVRARVLDVREIRRLSMGSFLSVTRGSDEPPRLIVLEYRGGERAKRRSRWSARASHSTPAAFR